MILSLSEAVLRTQLRRLGTAAGRSRLVAVAAGALWLIAPVAAWRLGRSVGGLLSSDTVTLTVTRGLVLGLAVASAAAGAALGAATPGRRALGSQVAAAPVTRAVAVAALALPVVGGATLLVGPTLAALAAALASSSPGGAGAAFSLALSFAAAAASGAVSAEAGLHLSRRGSTAGHAVAGVAVAAITAAVAVEGAARAVAQGGLVLVASAAACALAAAGAGSTWIGLAATRPEPRATAPRRPLVPERRPVAAACCAAFALLSRAPDLRAALAAAASFALVGLGVGLAAGAPIPAALLLGGGACVVAAALVPLSVRGRLDPGAWVWRAGGHGVVAGGWAAASLGLVFLTLLPVGPVALARPRETAAAAAQVVALAVAGWAAALAAGAVVPRRAHGAGDDALSLGAFAVATVGIGAAATLAGPMLGRAGVPDAIAALLVLASASVGAVTLLGARWGSD